ncbi:glutamate ligase [Gramella sp. KN1008]|uniref:glutamate ligase n=1 Tax=Gramella sp. KN1008 TaxID=2529298 RepID=UPI00103CF7E3|nr:glutamate ligase [Gramella sp. KN1008]TBW28245.1 glutamate ligase [Gramella sp. KN1008]
MKNNPKIFSPLPGFTHLVASTQLLIKEVLSRGGTVEVLDDQYNLIEITIDNKIFKILGTTYTHTHSLLNHILCNNKRLCKENLKREGFQTPAFQIFRKEDQFKDLRLKFPIVLKPLETNHGIGIYVNIQSEEDFLTSISELLSKYNEIMVEEFIDGPEYRFLVIERKLIGVIQRIPANLKGDGIHSLSELLQSKNKDRGNDYTKPLMKISEQDFQKYLENSQLKSDYIPARNEIHQICKISNLSKGGDSIDVTEEISLHHKQLAIDICEKFDLPFAGIDIIIPDLNKNYYEVLEINERPMISMHSYPYKGINRRAEKYLLEHLLKN